MTVAEKIAEIKKIEGEKMHQIYVVSQTRKFIRGIVLREGKDCYRTFLLRNYAIDNERELEKEVKEVFVEEGEYINVWFWSGRTSKDTFNKYFIFIPRLSKNNKGISVFMGVEYTPVPPTTRIEL